MCSVIYNLFVKVRITDNVDTIVNAIDFMAPYDILCVYVLYKVLLW